jgi:hypothetical protein
MTKSKEMIKSRQATGTVQTKSWSEQPHDEAEGLPKLTRGSMIEAVWSVVPGSGTGELRGLRGAGGYYWDGQAVAYKLDYDFG